MQFSKRKHWLEIPHDTLSNIDHGCKLWYSVNPRRNYCDDANPRKRISVPFGFQFLSQQQVNNKALERIHCVYLHAGYLMAGPARVQHVELYKAKVELVDHLVEGEAVELRHPGQPHVGQSGRDEVEEEKGPKTLHAFGTLTIKSTVFCTCTCVPVTARPGDYGDTRQCLVGVCVHWQVQRDPR